MSDKSALDHLADAQGLGSSYYDHRGELREFSAVAKAALLSAMSYDVHDAAAIETAMSAEKRARWTKILPPVCVCTQGTDLCCELSLPLTAAGEVAWRLSGEDEFEISGKASLAELERTDSTKIDGVSFAKLKLKLAPDVPLGYHHLEVECSGMRDSTRLIVAPARCFEPEVLARGQRCWGLSIQLYTLRSNRNWGMGDLGDLQELIECVAPARCALIGLNPLHALRPADPTHISPYSPSSRQFFNVLYIAVPLVPEYAECTLAQRYAQSAKQRARLEKLRAEEKVDYAGVAAAKFTTLRLLHAYFRQQHLAHDTPRAQAFQAFLKRRGEALRLHALYDALDQHFFRKQAHSWGWQSWPEAYRDAASEAVRLFEQEHAEEVEFFAFLQWLVTEQLGLVQAHARAHGMSIGVYGDVAVGVNPNGSESWANQALYLQRAAIGAPPDPLALKGQDWGIPPQNPNTLRAQAYEPFVRMLRNNMRQTGALRIDHVMALCRLWWVPRGFVATDGVYVRYPLQDLMAITALESVRNRCLVIGEDLGTVPDQMREAMERYRLFHYKVLFFEKDSDGQFKPPERYLRHALATITTHDLPTLKSWWESHDIELRDSLRLYPDAAAHERVLREREQDRRALMTALTGSGLWHWQAHEPLPPYSHALMRAVHLYLGLSAAALAMIQMEDLLGMREPVNVPGTSNEYPNWQRKLSLSAKELFERADIQEVLLALNRARGGENPNSD